MKRLLAFWLLWTSCASSWAATAPLPPPDLEARVGWDQRLGARLPGELHFREADGRVTGTAQIARGKPLVLSLGYYRCPNLCGMVLHGLGDAAADMSLQPGRGYEIAFLSIDPDETPSDAAASAHRLARMHPRAHVERWHFLTADAATIDALADAVGYRYYHDARNQQFAHAAGAVVLSGGERVTRYFFGVAFPPEALRLALVDASRGKLGGVIDHLVLLCSGYDPATGRYSVLVGRVMQLLGAGFALLFVGGLLWSRFRERSTP